MCLLHVILQPTKLQYFWDKTKRIAKKIATFSLEDGTMYLVPVFPVTTPIPLAEDKPILCIKKQAWNSTLVLA